MLKHNNGKEILLPIIMVLSSEIPNHTKKTKEMEYRGRFELPTP